MRLPNCCCHLGHHIHHKDSLIAITYLVVFWLGLGVRVRLHSVRVIFLLAVCWQWQHLKLRYMTVILFWSVLNEPAVWMLGWFTYVWWKKIFCRLECTQFHFVYFVIKYFCAKNYSNRMIFGGCSMACSIFLWQICSPHNIELLNVSCTFLDA